MILTFAWDGALLDEVFPTMGYFHLWLPCRNQGVSRSIVYIVFDLQPSFSKMANLWGGRHGTLSMVWETSVLDLNEPDEQLAFNYEQHIYPATIVDTIGRLNNMTIMF